MLERKGYYGEVAELLEPLKAHPDDKTRKLVLPLLLKAYERTGKIIEAAEIRDRLSHS